VTETEKGLWPEDAGASNTFLSCEAAAPAEADRSVAK